MKVFSKILALSLASAENFYGDINDFPMEKYLENDGTIADFVDQHLFGKMILKSSGDLGYGKVLETIKGQNIQTTGDFLEALGVPREQGYSGLGMVQARKFKHVISLILYLQKIPLAGKFIYYGCYCFANAQFDLDAGFGKPVDPIDRACKNFHTCYGCIRTDFVKEQKQEDCDGTDRSYFFSGTEDPSTGERKIICLNELGSCKRSICECDKKLAEELSNSEFEWSLFNHGAWGGFDREANCVANSFQSRLGSNSVKPVVQNRCCGEYPNRFKYAAKTSDGSRRSCCNGKTYDLDGPLVCCQDRDLIEFGNCLPGDVTIDKPALDEQFYGA